MTSCGFPDLLILDISFFHKYPWKVFDFGRKDDSFISFYTIYSSDCSFTLMIAFIYSSVLYCSCCFSYSIININ